MKDPSLSKQAYPPITEKVLERTKKIVNYIFTHSKKTLMSLHQFLKANLHKLMAKTDF